MFVATVIHPKSNSRGIRFFLFVIADLVQYRICTEYFQCSPVGPLSVGSQCNVPPINAKCPKGTFTGVDSDTGRQGKLPHRDRRLKYKISD